MLDPFQEAVLSLRRTTEKADGERYRVEDSEMKVSKKKREPSRSLMGRPSLPMPSKQKPESLERKKRQADYMKKHGKNPPRRKTLSVTNSYKKEVEGLK
jgi:hypothetical protein